MCGTVLTEAEVLDIVTELQPNLRKLPYAERGCANDARVSLTVSRPCRNNRIFGQGPARALVGALLGSTVTDLNLRCARAGPTLRRARGKAARTLPTLRSRARVSLSRCLFPAVATASGFRAPGRLRPRCPAPHS